MASPRPNAPLDPRRAAVAGSPRPKGAREHRDTLCRNVVIYGHCRYEETCAFNHNPKKPSTTPAPPTITGPIVPKKPFNVNSPSFTPAGLQPPTAPAALLAKKQPTFTSQAASAPVFTPRGGTPATAVTLSSAPTAKENEPSVPTPPPPPSSSSLSSSAFNPANVKEFTPQISQVSSQAHSSSYDFDGGNTNTNANANAANAANAAATMNTDIAAAANPYVVDPFSMANMANMAHTMLPTTLQPQSQQHQQPHHSQFNPYATDPTSLSVRAAAYYHTRGGYANPSQPLLHHLYFHTRPQRPLLPYQRCTHDFFMNEDLRQEIERKAEAGRVYIPNSLVIEHYHSIMTVDLHGRKGAGVFGYPSWLYKAVSSKNGLTFCLRRLEGFRLTDEAAVKTISDWKRVDNCNIVTLYDCFTTRVFRDSSLMFAQHYYPASKTLMSIYFPSSSTSAASASASSATTTTAASSSFLRSSNQPRIQEPELWNIIVQITNALRAIHTAKLAARCLDLTKIIITEKNVVRLSGCAIMDVTKWDSGKTMTELQQEDFVLLGRVILSLATSTPPSQLNDLPLAIEQMTSTRSYSSEMRDMLRWLITPAVEGQIKTVDNLLSGTSQHIMTSFNASLRERDLLYSNMFKEIGNGRVARLMMQLNMVLGRENIRNDPKWGEHGERYQLRLFSDYVFHQVDRRTGHHVIDLGHQLRCLNKLDAGAIEHVRLTSLDGETDFIVTYRDIKRMLNLSFLELVKASPRNTGRFL